MADHQGRVVDYDARRGLGTVQADDDGRRLGFHCTAISDGSRDTRVDARVTFQVVPGHLGTWEAAAIRSG